ncbi:MAG: septum formation initiator family protein [Candidatus Magasanikbacteria bacterium]
MPIRQEPTRLRMFFSSRLFVILFFGLSLVLVCGFMRSYYRDYKVKEEIRQLETQIDALSKQKLESMEILQYVMSDDYVEEKARTELNLKKPGEGVMIVEDTETKTPSTSEEDEASGRILKNPLKWWYYFTQGKE